MEQINPEELRNQFIGWQCRIRQYSVRKDGGRPSPGMCPGIEINDENVGQITVLIVKADSQDITREFRHILAKTQDPRARYDSAIKLLSEYYFQLPAEFDDELTAIFSIANDRAENIIENRNCRLRFVQGNQTYHLECQARSIAENDEKYQATYWHNHLFNPTMPGVVNVILGFMPDWHEFVVFHLEMRSPQ